MRIHTLSVLAVIARAARGSENLQTLVVADSFSIQTFCEEGNVQYAEVLMKRCEEALKDLGEDCRPVVKHLFHVAKSQLLMYKGMVSETSSVSRQNLSP